ncbi:porin family protein [Ferrimonas marina]|uniref:Uncharacterized protein n=1 Tax=Ferrimonas marina TaxID=299255 RepID=A0A1M5RBW2_9GAMM|nr:porin family protein [Ferrimonas marina]SHH23526.1 hypothetical protein SAMN02745129_1554 [Ferrimonas marina]
MSYQEQFSPYQVALSSAKWMTLFVGLSIGADAMAEQTEEEFVASAGKPNVFEQHGLPANLPKLGLSSLSQSEHLLELATRRYETEDGVEESQAFLVQTTDTKGNIDLRIKYNPSELDEHEDLVDRIETLTRSQYRLKKYAQSYDRSSVQVDEQDNGQLVISFNYSKFGLPQDIAYFRHMQVEVVAQDGEVETMTVTNREPFDLDGYRINEYRQTLNFRTLENGRVLMAQKVLDAKGTRKGKPVSLHLEVTPVAVYDDELGTVVLDDPLLQKASDPRLREQTVKLHRVFPLMGDMVRRQGIDLPLPFGVSVSYRNQNMDVGFNDFDIMGAILNDVIDPEATFGDVNAEILTVRGDVNILPFWNVFGHVGKLNVTADVDAQYTGLLGDVLEDNLGTIGGPMACNYLEGQLGANLCDPTRFNVPLDLNYTIAGVGTTLSVGYKQFFASVTASFTKTLFENSDHWGDGVLTVQPMLGYQFADARAQVFIGAEYQDLDPRMTGNLGYIDALGRDFTYDVGVELNKWAGLIGFNKQIGKNFNLTALYNLGETRDSFTLNLGYRF